MELCLNRAKPGETLVEARRDSDPSLKLGFALYVHDGDEKEAKPDKVFASSFK